MQGLKGKNPTPGDSTKYELLLNVGLDLNNHLLCRKSNCNELSSVLAQWKPTETTCGSSEVTQGADRSDTSILRQSFSALIAVDPTQSTRRDKVQDKPMKTPVYVWH